VFRAREFTETVAAVEKTFEHEGRKGREGNQNRHWDKCLTTEQQDFLSGDIKRDVLREFEVLVCREGQHGYGFAFPRQVRRRARTPTGPERCSLLARMASDRAFLVRKYSSTSEGRRM
jgi:hypothetical protein